MLNDIERVLISEEELARKVSEAADAINRDFAGKEPVIVSVLRGSFVFMADLVRKLNMKCTIEFITASVYKNGTAPDGKPDIGRMMLPSLKGKDVLIVEDILDTGVTLHALKELLMQDEPASLKICTLMDKPSRRKADIYADYSCFEVPDEFVVGYGLDYAQKYRNLPFVGVLKPEIYE